MKFRLLSWLVPLALVGCASLGPTSSAPPVAARPDRADGVTVRARLDVRDHGGRQLLAAVLPWVKADVDHVALHLFAEPNATAVATITLNQADLAKTVSIGSLSTNTSYRIEARAWADATEATPIDDFEANAAGCTTRFATTNDDWVDIGVIALRLKDKTFSGVGEAGGLGIMDGTVKDTSAPPGFEIR